MITGIDYIFSYSFAVAVRILTGGSRRDISGGDSDALLSASYTSGGGLIILRCPRPLHY